jgi:hypothetical protein
LVQDKRAVLSINTVYHPECLRCLACLELISPGKLINKHGKIYHTSCYEARLRIDCDSCKKQIEDEYILCGNKNYHKECFSISSKLDSDAAEENKAMNTPVVES